MKRLWMVAVLGTVLAATPLRAEDKPVKEPETPKVTDPAKPFDNKGQEKKVAQFAAKYKVSEESIRSMRTSGKGMGWGEIGHALAISEKSGQPLADILKLRESGMGWGEIAKKYNFKLGDISGKAKDIKKEGEKAERADDKSDKGHSGASNKGAAGRANAGSHGNSKK